MRLSAAQVEAMREADEARIQVLTRDLARTDSMLDYQPRVSPHLSRRPDLAPIFDVFERAYRASIGEGRPIIALISAPPQVGKTLAVQHCLACWLTRRPSAGLAFVTYNTPLSETKSRGVRDIAIAAGVQVRTDSSAVSHWHTTGGGSLLARGRDGGITGQSGLDCIVVSDPYASRAEAESAAISASINDTISGVIMTRRHPRTSVIVEHTRWTPNDLVGALGNLLRGRTASMGIDLIEVNLPCVDVETGEPLITFGGRDRAFYEAQRTLVSEHDWWSLYMGSPRPREGKLFRGAFTYAERDRPGRYASAIGMDLAYTAKKSGDWSVAVVLARELDVEPGQRPRFYVLHVERARCEVSEWAQRMAALRVRFPAAPLYMRTGGQEAALLDTMRVAHGLTVSHEPTRGDKRQNALALADEWREGRVLVPESASWDVSGFLGRVLDFSGQAASEVDDEIDALVTAHSKLMLGVEMAGPAYVPAGRVPLARGGLF